MQIPKGQWLANPHKKLFTTHLLTSPENQKKIKEADEAATEKGERVIQKAKLIKNLLAADKIKKKVTCRSDTVKARELPRHVVMGRGRGRGRGRSAESGGPKL